MFRALLFVITVLVITACSGPKKTAQSPKAQPELSDSRRADVTYLFFNANKEKILGNLDNAAALFAEVIRKDGGNHAAMYEISKIYVQQKKYADALFFSKTAYKLDPANEWYALNHIEILQKNGKFAESAAVCEQLVKDFPDRIDFYFEWVSALLYAEKPTEAIKVLDRIEAKSGVTKDVSIQKQRLYLQLGKTDKAIFELQRLIDNDPKDAQAYGLLAELYQKLGQKNKALELYNKILEVDPDNPYIHLSLADFYRSNGEKEKSVEALQKAFSNKNLPFETKLQIIASYYSLVDTYPELLEQALQMCDYLINAHPTEPAAYAVHGDFLGKQKEYEKSRAEYRKAIEMGSTDFVVYQQLMLTDAQLQDWDALWNDSKNAISLFADQPSVYFFNGIASSQKKNYQQAVDILNQGLKLVVDNKNLEGQFYSSLGDAYQELKNFPKSNENYEKALEINPNDANVLNNYAYYLSLRGEQMERAEKMSKLSNELEPNQPSYEDTYGWIMYKTGRYAEAKEWIEKSLKHSETQSATVLEHLGDVLYKLEDKNGAMDYWEKAMKAGEGASEFLPEKIRQKKLIE